MFTEGTDRKPFINFTCIRFLDERKSWPTWQGWTWHLCYNDRWEGKVPWFYVVIIFAFQVQLMYHEGLHDRVLSLSLLTWHAILDKFWAPLEENTTISSNQSWFCSFLCVWLTKSDVRIDKCFHFLCNVVASSFAFRIMMT